MAVADLLPQRPPQGLFTLEGEVMSRDKNHTMKCVTLNFRPSLSNTCPHFGWPCCFYTATTAPCAAAVLLQSLPSHTLNLTQNLQGNTRVSCTQSHYATAGAGAFLCQHCAQAIQVSHPMEGCPRACCHSWLVGCFPQKKVCQ